MLLELKVAAGCVLTRSRRGVRQENLQEFMLDKRGRDQFVIRYGDETEIYWNDAARSQAEDVYKRSTWTESFVQWSPAGNYLATIHRQGVAVWGGPSWQRLARFSHPGVRPATPLSPGSAARMGSLEAPAEGRAQTSGAPRP